MSYSPKIELYQIKYTQITFLGLVNIKKNIGSFSETSPESRHKLKLGLKNRKDARARIHEDNNVGRKDK